MIQSVKRTALTSIVLGLLIAVGAGCAQDVGDIDRTQPDKVDKEVFQNDDEWYFQQTVVDTDYQGSGPVFSALESSLKRVRWKITKDFLYAYSTTSPQEGLHEEQMTEDEKRLGAVAIFPIRSHFDVQRQYNPSTGEPTNVIVENRSDRPWHERDHMRVEWSMNLVDGSRNFGYMMGALSSVAYDIPQEEDRVHPNRARINDDYIDVTVRYAFQPDVMACVQNLGINALSYCNAGKVQVRNSFQRITEEKENSYDPMVYNDTKTLHRTNENGEREQIMTDEVYERGQNYLMEVECNSTTAKYLEQEYGSTTESCDPAEFGYFNRFGYFRTRRQRFNKERPNTDASRRYYANRWDIFEDIDIDGDGEAEPQPKPIVYHLNAQYPRDMIPAAKEVEQQWDETMKEAVRLKAEANGYDYGSDDEQAQGGPVAQQLRKIGEDFDRDLVDNSTLRPEDADAYKNGKMFYIRKNDCLPGPLAEWKENHGQTTGADRKDIQQLFADVTGGATGDELVEQLWSSPVEERIQLCADLEWATAERNDPEARFTYQRRGDLRHSFFNWVREYNGYWSGYGPSAADPKTGEIISANANYAGTPLRSTAEYGADLIQYMNGDLSNQDIRFGSHIEKYLNNVEDRRQQALKPGDLPADVEKELERRANRNPSEVSSTDFDEELPDPKDLPDRIKRNGLDKWDQKVNELSRNIDQAKKSDTTFSEFYDKPKVKKQLMKDGQFQMLVKSTAHQRFGADPTDEEMHQAYLDLANPKLMHRRQRKAEQWMAEHNMFATRNLRRAVEGLATYKGVAEAFKDKDREELVRYMTDNAFIGTQLHEVGHTVGLRHNFSASRDALNWHDEYWKIQKEVATNENVVKEMPDNTQGDNIQSAYALQGDIIQKITDEDTDYLNEEEFQQASIMDYTSDLTGRFAGLGKYDQAAINFAYGEHVQVWEEEFDKPNRLSFDKWLADYSRLPELYGGAQTDDGAAEEEKFKEGVEVITQKRKWIPIEDAIQRRLDGIEDNTDLAQKWWAGEGAQPGDDPPYIPQTVPYNFCSDRKADYARNCSTFDHGGNYTEVVNHGFNSWRFFQPFWRYKGQSTDYGFPYGYQLINNYALRVMRTLYAAERPFRFFSIYEWLGYDLGDRTEDLKASSINALNFYAELMAMPEPGRYCKYDKNNFRRDSNWYYDLENSYVPASRHSERGDCPNYIDVPRGIGQFYNYDLTDEYNFRIRRVGTYIDKMLASRSFFNVSGNWINSGFVTDSRTTNITFYSLFKDEMLDWLGSMIMGDASGFAGTYDKVDNTYRPPKVVDLETFGKGGETQIGTNQPRVRSPFSFNQELNTLAGAMLVNSSWQDQSVDFQQYIKVIRQEEDKQDFGDGTEMHSFTHPVTQVTYSAPETADDRSISVEIVAWANDLKSKWEYASCLEQTFDPSKSDTQYLKDACGDRSLPININTSSSDAVQTTRENLSELEEIRLRQLEEVVAKLTMIRDVSQLTDLR